MIKSRILLKSIALGLISTLLLEPVCWGVSEIAGPRALSAPIGPAQLAEKPWLLSVPAEHGTLEEFHRGTNGKLIIHIQDPHSNTGGQEHLAAVLRSVAKSHSISLVLSEGGAGDSSLLELRQELPAKAWKHIAKQWLRKAWISGEEYLNLTDDQPLTIYGIENMESYFSSVRAYAGLAARREKSLEYLSLVGRAADQLKKRIYPEDLLSYESLAADDSKFGERMDRLTDWLQRADPKDLEVAEFVRMMELRRAEEGIDLKRIRLEYAALFEMIAKRDPQLARAMNSVSSNLISVQPAVLYARFQRLLESAKRAQVPLDSYPILIEYTALLSRYASMDWDRVLEEMDRVEKAMFRARLEGRPAKILRSIDRYTGLLRSAFSVQMTSQQFSELEANEKSFMTFSALSFLNRQLMENGLAENLVPYRGLLEDGKEDLRHFYGTVNDRDLNFVQNSEEVMESKNEAAAVLIAGGYHTEHLRRLFVDKGFSFVTIRPVVTHETNLRQYEEQLFAPLKSIRPSSTPEISIPPDSAGRTVRKASLAAILTRPEFETGARLVREDMEAYRRARLSAEGRRPAVVKRHPFEPPDFDRFVRDMVNRLNRYFYDFPLPEDHRYWAAFSEFAEQRSLNMPASVVLPGSYSGQLRLAQQVYLKIYHAVRNEIRTQLFGEFPSLTLRWYTAVSGSGVSGPPTFSAASEAERNRLRSVLPRWKFFKDIEAWDGRRANTLIVFAEDRAGNPIPIAAHSYTMGDRAGDFPAGEVQLNGIFVDPLFRESPLRVGLRVRESLLAFLAQRFQVLRVPVDSGERAQVFHEKWLRRIPQDVLLGIEAHPNHPGSIRTVWLDLDRYRAAIGAAEESGFQAAGARLAFNAFIKTAAKLLLAAYLSDKAPALQGQEQASLTAAASRESVQAWRYAVTDPARHDPRSYRYIIHAVRSHRETEERYKALEDLKKRGAAVDPGAYLNVLKEPERLADKPLVSTSYVDQDHRGSWKPMGYILDVPVENILSTDRKDITSPYYEGMEWVKEQLKERDQNPLLYPGELLHQTNPRAYNELVIAGTHPFSKEKVKIIGVFISTRLGGEPIPDEQSLREITEVALRLGVPIIRIRPLPVFNYEKDTEPSVSIQASISLPTEREYEISQFHNHKRWSIYLSAEGAFRAHKDEEDKLPRPMTADEFSEFAERLSAYGARYPEKADFHMAYRALIGNKLSDRKMQVVQRIKALEAEKEGREFFEDRAPLALSEDSIAWENNERLYEVKVVKGRAVWTVHTPSRSSSAITTSSMSAKDRQRFMTAVNARIQELSPESEQRKQLEQILKKLGGARLALNVSRLESVSKRLDEMLDRPNFKFKPAVDTLLALTGLGAAGFYMTTLWLAPAASKDILDTAMKAVPVLFMFNSAAEYAASYPEKSTRSSRLKQVITVIGILLKLFARNFVPLRLFTGIPRMANLTIGAWVRESPVLITVLQIAAAVEATVYHAQHYSLISAVTADWAAGLGVASLVMQGAASLTNYFRDYRILLAQEKRNNNASIRRREQERKLQALGLTAFGKQGGRIQYLPGFKALALKVKQLIVIPHGETEANQKKFFHGGDFSSSLDSRLTPEGTASAKQGAARLWESEGEAIRANPSGFVIVESPLERTKETAQPFKEILSKNNIPVHHADILEGDFEQPVSSVQENAVRVVVSSSAVEIYFGGMNMKALEDLEGELRSTAEAYRKGNAFTKTYDSYSESFIDLLVRTAEFIDEINRLYPGKTVILYGHGTFTWALTVLLDPESVQRLGGDFIHWRDIPLKRGYAHVFEPAGARLALTREEVLVRLSQAYSQKDEAEFPTASVFGIYHTSDLSDLERVWKAIDLRSDQKLFDLGFGDARVLVSAALMGVDAQGVEGNLKIFNSAVKRTERVLENFPEFKFKKVLDEKNKAQNTRTVVWERGDGQPGSIKLVRADYRTYEMDFTQSDVIYRHDDVGGLEPNSLIGRKLINQMKPGSLLVQVQVAAAQAKFPDRFERVELTPKLPWVLVYRAGARALRSVPQESAGGRLGRQGERVRADQIARFEKMLAFSGQALDDNHRKLYLRMFGLFIGSKFVSEPMKWWIVAGLGALVAATQSWFLGGLTLIVASNFGGFFRTPILLYYKMRHGLPIGRALLINFIPQFGFVFAIPGQILKNFSMYKMYSLGRLEQQLASSIQSSNMTDKEKNELLDRSFFISNFVLDRMRGRVPWLMVPRINIYSAGQYLALPAVPNGNTAVLIVDTNEKREEVLNREGPRAVYFFNRSERRNTDDGIPYFITRRITKPFARNLQEQIRASLRGGSDTRLDDAMGQLIRSLDGLDIKGEYYFRASDKPNKLEIYTPSKLGFRQPVGSIEMEFFETPAGETRFRWRSNILSQAVNRTVSRRLLYLMSQLVPDEINMEHPLNLQMIIKMAEVLPENLHTHDIQKIINASRYIRVKGLIRSNIFEATAPVSIRGWNPIELLPDDVIERLPLGPGWRDVLGHIWLKRQRILMDKIVEYYVHDPKAAHELWSESSLVYKTNLGQRLMHYGKSITLELDSSDNNLRLVVSKNPEISGARLAVSGVMHPIYKEFDLAQKEIINPDNRLQDGLYGAAGMDLSHFLHSVNTPNNYFISEYHNLSVLDLKTFFDDPEGYFKQNGGTKLWDEFAEGYSERKYKYGFGAAFSMLSKSSVLAVLWIELLSLGITRGSEVEVLDNGGRPQISFNWTYPGATSKKYFFTFVDADVAKREQYADILRLPFDVYYQRASQNLPLQYEKPDNYIRWIYEALRAEGYFVTDDFALDPEDHRRLSFVDRGSRFPLGEDAVILIPVPGLEQFRVRMDEALAAITHYKNSAPDYGRFPRIRKKIGARLALDSGSAVNKRALGRVELRADEVVRLLDLSDDDWKKYEARLNELLKPIVVQLENQVKAELTPGGGNRSGSVIFKSSGKKTDRRRSVGPIPDGVGELEFQPGTPFSEVAQEALRHVMENGIDAYLQAIDEGAIQDNFKIEFSWDRGTSEIAIQVLNNGSDYAQSESTLEKINAGEARFGKQGYGTYLLEEALGARTQLLSRAKLDGMSGAVLTIFLDPRDLIRDWEVDSVGSRLARESKWLTEPLLDLLLARLAEHPRHEQGFTDGVIQLAWQRLDHPQARKKPFAADQVRKALIERGWIEKIGKLPHWGRLIFYKVSPKGRERLLQAAAVESVNRRLANEYDSFERAFFEVYERLAQKPEYADLIPRLAVAAYGGLANKLFYGQSSDLDLLVIVSPSADTSLAERFKDEMNNLLTAAVPNNGKKTRFMKKAGELARSPIDTFTFAQARYLAGSPDVYRGLVEPLRAAGGPNRWEFTLFFSRLEERLSQNRSLEGEREIKNMPGGLRTLSLLYQISGFLTGFKDQSFEQAMEELIRLEHLSVSEKNDAIRLFKILSWIRLEAGSIRLPDAQWPEIVRRSGTSEDELETLRRSVQTAAARIEERLLQQAEQGEGAAARAFELNRMEDPDGIRRLFRAEERRSGSVAAIDWSVLAAASANSNTPVDVLDDVLALKQYRWAFHFIGLLAANPAASEEHLRLLESDESLPAHFRRLAHERLSRSDQKAGARLTAEDWLQTAADDDKNSVRTVEGILTFNQRGPDGKRMVVKRAVGPWGSERIRRQYEFIQSLPPELRADFPEILYVHPGNEAKGDWSAYAMEQLNADSVASLLWHGSIHSEEAVQYWLNGFRAFWQFRDRYRQEVPADWKNRPIERVAGQVQEWEKTVSAPSDSLFRAQSVEIDGRRYTNMRGAIELIRELIRADSKNLLQPKFLTLAHQDLVLGNVMADNSKLMIDLLGERRGDPLFDWVNLVRSVDIEFAREVMLSARPTDFESLKYRLQASDISPAKGEAFFETLERTGAEVQRYSAEADGEFKELFDANWPLRFWYLYASSFAFVPTKFGDTHMGGEFNSAQLTRHLMGTVYLNRFARLYADTLKREGIAVPQSIEKTLAGIEAFNPDQPVHEQTIVYRAAQVYKMERQSTLADLTKAPVAILPTWIEVTEAATAFFNQHTVPVIAVDDDEMVGLEIEDKDAYLEGKDAPYSTEHLSALLGYGESRRLLYPIFIRLLNHRQLMEDVRTRSYSGFDLHSYFPDEREAVQASKIIRDESSYEHLKVIAGNKRLLEKIDHFTREVPADSFPGVFYAGQYYLGVLGIQDVRTRTAVFRYADILPVDMSYFMKTLSAFLESKGWRLVDPINSVDASSGARLASFGRLPWSTLRRMSPAAGTQAPEAVSAYDFIRNSNLFSVRLMRFEHEVRTSNDPEHLGNLFLWAMADASSDVRKGAVITLAELYKGDPEMAARVMPIEKMIAIIQDPLFMLEQVRAEPYLPAGSTPDPIRTARNIRYAILWVLDHIVDPIVSPDAEDVLAEAARVRDVLAVQLTKDARTWSEAREAELVRRLGHINGLDMAAGFDGGKADVLEFLRLIVLRNSMFNRPSDFFHWMKPSVVKIYPPRAGIPASDIIYSGARLSPSVERGLAAIHAIAGFEREELFDDEGYVVDYLQNDSDRMMVYHRPGNFAAIHNSDGRQNVPLIAEYGFYGLIGRGTLAWDIQASYEPADLLLAFNIPKDRIEQEWQDGWGYALNESSRASLHPDLLKRAESDPVLAGLMRHLLRNPSEVGHLEPEWIDWHETLRGTVIDRLISGKGHLWKRVESMPSDEEIARTFSEAKEAIISALKLGFGARLVLDFSRSWDASDEDFRNAIEHFNTYVLPSGKFTWENFVELYELFRADRRNPLYDETERAERLQTGKLQFASSLMDRVNQKGFSRDEAAVEAARIYLGVSAEQILRRQPGFMFVSPLKADLNKLHEKQASNGHHRISWLLMNYFLINNGYAPFYFSNEDEYERVRQVVDVPSDRGWFIGLVRKRTAASTGARLTDGGAKGSDLYMAVQDFVRILGQLQPAEELNEGRKIALRQAVWPIRIAMNERPPFFDSERSPIEELGQSLPADFPDREKVIAGIQSLAQLVNDDSHWVRQELGVLNRYLSKDSAGARLVKTYEMDGQGLLSGYSLIIREESYDWRTRYTVQIRDKSNGRDLRSRIDVRIYTAEQMIDVDAFYPNFPDKTDSRYVEGRGRELLRLLVGPYSGHTIVSPALDPFQKSFALMKDFEPITELLNRGRFERIKYERIRNLDPGSMSYYSLTAATLIGKVPEGLGDWRINAKFYSDDEESADGARLTESDSFAIQLYDALPDQGEWSPGIGEFSIHLDDVLEGRETLPVGAPDRDSLLLALRAYVANPRVLRELIPMNTEGRNLAVRFEKGILGFYTMEEGREVRFGTVSFSQKSLIAALEANKAHFHQMRDQSLQQYLLQQTERTRASIAAFGESEARFRQAVKAYAGGKNVVVEVGIDREGWNSAALASIMAQVRRAKEFLKSRNDANAYVRFISLDGRTVHEDLSDVLPEQYETVYVSPPADGVLGAAFAAEAGYLSVDTPMVEGDPAQWNAVPYAATVIAAVMLGRSDKRLDNERLDQLLANLIATYQTGEGGRDAAFRDLKRVSRMDRARYQTLIIHAVQKLNLDQLLEFSRLVLQAVGTAA